MTAAECVGDKDPHVRDTAGGVLNAQSADSEGEVVEVNKHTEESAPSVVESAAGSLSYSAMTFVFAVAGLSSYFM